MSILKEDVVAQFGGWWVLGWDGQRPTRGERAVWVENSFQC